MEKDRTTFGVKGSVGCTRRHMMIVLAILNSEKVTIIDTESEYKILRRLEEEQKLN
ncbi:hypothetical protein D3C76_1777790 [compost metagenome]